MTLTSRRATVFLCSATAAIIATSAFARPVHHHHRNKTVAGAHVSQGYSGADSDVRYSKASREGATPATVENARSRGDARWQGRRHLRARASMHANSAFGGATSNALVGEARKYIGTNPTGRSRLWCGAFMDMVLRRTGHRGGGNLAKAYARYGTRVPGPRVGAIAVMNRRGGGHVGVVSGIDPNGNPIVVSGNHNRTVAESVYPASRITAYVIPGS